MTTYSGETKCPQCGHWQIPMNFCPSCGHAFGGVFTTNGTYSQITYGEMLCSCEVFIPSPESTALKCVNCGKSPRRLNKTTGTR